MKNVMMHLKMIVNKEHTLSDVADYFRGNIRYYFYYKHPFLIRNHIREQIQFRLRMMQTECYKNGSCVMCGCTTPHLQMANKACDKPCYPEMMNKKDWELFLKGHSYTDKNGVWQNRNIPDDILGDISKIKFIQFKCGTVK